jgi:hypothetical protein
LLKQKYQNQVQLIKTYEATHQLSANKRKAESDLQNPKNTKIAKN